MQKGAPS